MGSQSFDHQRERAKLAELYVRVADALERSGQLAVEHADRNRSDGQMASTEVELERARQARQAAQRGRALASKLR